MKPEVIAKGDVTKPSSLNVHQEVLRRPKQGSKLTSAPSEKEPATRSLSDQYFIGLLWGLVLTRVWIHFWLVCILLPIPMGLWIVKKASMLLLPFIFTLKLYLIKTVVYHIMYDEYGWFYTSLF
jgi:hypothetical protein